MKFRRRVQVAAAALGQWRDGVAGAGRHSDDLGRKAAHVRYRRLRVECRVRCVFICAFFHAICVQI